MSSWIRSLFGRGLALLQIALMLSAGCTSDSLAPTPGAAEYLASGMVDVPGGVVNAAGGNLLIERTDLTLDSLVGGSLAISAVYNSSLGSWTWSFGIHFDGAVLTDASGRGFDTAGLADGSAIPGTHWVQVDSDTVQTKGGLAHDFDSLGRLAVVHWATLDYPRIRYTWSASELQIAQCTTATACTAFYAVAFDSSQRPVSVTDSRSGRRAEYTWNGSGQLAVAKSPFEVEMGRPGTRYEYGLMGALTALTSSEGERIEYAYQSGRRIHAVTQIGEGNPTHRFDFSAAGSDGIYPTLYTNPLGARTRFYFDPEYRLQEIELVERGERRSFTWAGFRPASVTLEDGATTAYVYQGDDPVEITDAAGNTTEIVYQAGGLDQQSPRSRPIARIEDSLGLVEERSYDGSGRVTSIRNGENESAQLAYNGVSLVSSLVQPSGAALGFPLYGQHGHWLEMDGAVSDKRSFDPVGNARVESAKGRRGGVLNQQFDAMRNLAVLNVAATDASGVTATGAISIERRSDGQPLAVRRPYGGDHEFVYDDLGRLAEQRERVNGQWQATLFERDLGGNTTARVRPNGMREEWEYDGYGRVVAYRALRGQTLEGEAVYTYQDGQLVSMFDSIRGGAEQYGYDAAGRLVATSYGYGEVRSLEYDLRSRVTAEVLSVPGQTLFDIGFEYDLANRLVRTLDRAAQEVLIEHVVENGELVQTRYGNGLERDYSYDAAGLLIASETRNAQAQLIESTAIARTGETNPVRLQIRVATTTPLASTVEEYWLDSGEQLSDPGRRVFGFRSGPGTARYYAYDELSNQLSVPGGASYLYNAEHNRLLSAGAVSYSYDAAGFATSRGGVPLTWTAAGRLASYGSATAQWDLSGRPIQLSFDGVTKRFDLFGGRVESNASNGSVGSLDLGEVSLAPLSGARIYRHLDFRGNVSFVTNDSGQVTDHHRYGPYGAEQHYGAGTNRSTFVGKPEVGPFLLLGARIYDPAIGRFVSPDPLPIYTNQFAYTSGNPVMFIDDSGLFEVKASTVRVVLLVIAAAAGMVVAVAVVFPAVATVVVAGVPLVAAAKVTGALATAGAAYYSVAMELYGADVSFIGPFGDAGGSSGTGGGGGGGGGGSGGGGGGGQVKNLTFEGVGSMSMVNIAPAPPTSCSPSTLSGVPIGREVVSIFLFLTSLVGVAYLSRHTRFLGSTRRRIER